MKRIRQSLALRLAPWLTHDDGWVENVGPVSAEDVDREVEASLVAIRAQLARQEEKDNP